MSNVWDGTGLFLWQADAVYGGDAQQMVNAAKSLGLTYVLIKFSEGSLAGDPVSQKFMADFKRLAPYFKNAGLKVGGWTFQWLTDVSGEVDACAQAIEAGADFIVLDAENGVYGKDTQVQQFGQEFRAKFPNIPVGLSSFAISNYHDESVKQVPFNVYNGFVDFMMPQVYWDDMGWNMEVAFTSSIASYEKYGKPIAPTGQAYGGATPSDMAGFIHLCKTKGYTGVSWWDWQHATQDQLKALQQNLILPPVPPQNITSSIAADVPEGQWYSKAVKYCLDEGLMSKDSNSRFNPDAPVDRKELAQVIFNTRHQK